MSTPSPTLSPLPSLTSTSPLGSTSGSLPHSRASPPLPSSSSPSSTASSSASLLAMRRPQVLPPGISVLDVGCIPANEYLAILLSYGVRHASVHPERSLLDSDYLDSVAQGCTNTLAYADTLKGPRPESATRGIARSPSAYGAQESLSQALMLAHAHCAVYDLAAADCCLTNDPSYRDILNVLFDSLAPAPAVVVSSTAIDSWSKEILGVPNLEYLDDTQSMHLGLRSSALGIVGPGGFPLKGMSLVPHMTDKAVLWAFSHHAIEGWFPWLHIEVHGLASEPAAAHARGLTAMRLSLGMYAQLQSLAMQTVPDLAKDCPIGATRLAYSLQTCGTMWRLYAMADGDGVFPVRSVWSGSVDGPTDMARAVAILRQIGAESLARQEQVRLWLRAICGQWPPAESLHSPCSFSIAMTPEETPETNSINLPAIPSHVRQPTPLSPEKSHLRPGAAPFMPQKAVPEGQPTLDLSAWPPLGSAGTALGLEILMGKYGAVCADSALPSTPAGSSSTSSPQLAAEELPPSPSIDAQFVDSRPGSVPPSPSPLSPPPLRFPPGISLSHLSSPGHRLPPGLDVSSPARPDIGPPPGLPPRSPFDKAMSGSGVTAVKPQARPLPICGQHPASTPDVSHFLSSSKVVYVALPCFSPSPWQPQEQNATRNWPSV